MPAIGGLSDSSSGMSEMTALFANADAVIRQKESACTLTALNPSEPHSEDRMSHYEANGVGRPKRMNQRSAVPRGRHVLLVQGDYPRPDRGSLYLPLSPCGILFSSAKGSSLG